jgi:hypothetical protein
MSRQARRRSGFAGDGAVAIIYLVKRIRQRRQERRDRNGGGHDRRPAA